MPSASERRPARTAILPSHEPDEPCVIGLHAFLYAVSVEVHAQRRRRGGSRLAPQADAGKIEEWLAGAVTQGDVVSAAEAGLDRQTQPLKALVDRPAGYPQIHAAPLTLHHLEDRGRHRHASSRERGVCLRCMQRRPCECALTDAKQRLRHAIAARTRRGRIRQRSGGFTGHDGPGFGTALDARLPLVGESSIRPAAHPEATQPRNEPIHAKAVTERVEEDIAAARQRPGCILRPMRPRAAFRRPVDMAAEHVVAFG